MQKHILEIRRGLQQDLYEKEAAVSQGIVIRVLKVLGWPVFNPQVVFPQFGNVDERSAVDFALCNNQHEPRAIIEVKRKGGANSKAQTQLFDYAYHMEVEMALLTDGCTWQFYVSNNRRMLLDKSSRVQLCLLHEDVDECALRLSRYLSYQSLISGDSINALRQDGRDRSRNIAIRRVLPKALEMILEPENDYILVDVVSTNVEKLCGELPNDELVADFIKENLGEIAAHKYSDRATSI